MNFSAREIADAAASTGHNAESLERVVRLVELLNDLRVHPFLAERLALKGGTALNLFTFDIPRLSVDIDLNYIGAGERPVMLAEKPRVLEALRAVFERQQLTVKRLPEDKDDGFKSILGYRRGDGQPGNLELDVNFMLRVPLWPPERADSRSLAGRQARSILILDRHELAAGKLHAAFTRKKSRDLFDLERLLGHVDFDVERLRLGFVAYGGMSRDDWRTRTLEHLDASVKDVERQLTPMLRRGAAPSRQDLAEWTRRMVENCRVLAGSLLPLRPNEREFLDGLNDRGEIRPELLTADLAFRERLARHPQLLWKAQNVRQHRGR